jgi:hypothetical protein
VDNLKARRVSCFLRVSERHCKPAFVWEKQRWLFSSPGWGAGFGCHRRGCRFGSRRDRWLCATIRWCALIWILSVASRSSASCGTVSRDATTIVSSRLTVVVSVAGVFIVCLCVVRGFVTWVSIGSIFSFRLWSHLFCLHFILLLILVVYCFLVFGLIVSRRFSFFLLLIVFILHLTGTLNCSIGFFLGLFRLLVLPEKREVIERFECKWAIRVVDEPKLFYSPTKEDTRGYKRNSSANHNIIR